MTTIAYPDLESDFPRRRRANGRRCGGGHGHVIRKRLRAQGCRAVVALVVAVIRGRLWFALSLARALWHSYFGAPWAGKSVWT